MNDKAKPELAPFILPEGYHCIAGVDEVGRGPLVGAVVTSAVILDPNVIIDGLTDSKKLTEKKRQELFPIIKERALAWSIGRCEAHEIDELNILQATLLAMKRAIEELPITPDFALIDGNKLPNIDMPAQAVVKGDLRVAQISAASILAKVTRDQEMKILDARYPQYGFAKHNGYPTKQHLEAINQHGIAHDEYLLSQYRKSFKPVKLLLDANR